jgi:hypothetical protein
VAESALLLRRLRRVRRRARVLAALEGGVTGLAVAAGLSACLGLVARARGHAVPWRTAVIGAVAGALVGLVAGAARRISLGRCARLVDATLDRGGAARDRVLSALSFLDGPATPFTQAAIGDALARARALAPALIAPARPPRALAGLAMGLAVLALVGAWPGRAPGSLAPGDLAPLTRAAAAPFKVGAGALRVEREAERDAREAARRAHDEELAALSDHLRATLEALTTGALERGDALERLNALAARARDAADESARAQAGLRAAGAALERTPATRPAGRALAGADPAATERALRELAAKTATASAAGQSDIARAFASAAAGAGHAAADDAAAEESGPRRLRREREGGAGAAAGASSERENHERRLERLRRDLDDTAAACRADPAACRRGLEDHAAALANAQRGAAGSDARRRLESAVSQLRERLRRGALDGTPRGGAQERAFQRAARGGGEARDGQSAPGGHAETGGEAELAEGVGDDGPQDPSGDDFSAASEASAAGRGATSAAGANEGVSQGAGIGRSAGGDPLGGRDVVAEARGHERQARVRDGAGPTRAAVIEAAARRGFATSDYVRVYGDYAPVAEEAIASAAVPEGRRYVVRRYFQLIRPRTPPPTRTP